jgi:hypothetical protein
VPASFPAELAENIGKIACAPVDSSEFAQILSTNHVQGSSPNTLGARKRYVITSLHAACPRYQALRESDQIMAFGLGIIHRLLAAALLAGLLLSLLRWALA